MLCLILLINMTLHLSVLLIFTGLTGQSHSSFYHLCFFMLQEGGVVRWRYYLIKSSKSQTTPPWEFHPRNYIKVDNNNTREGIQVCYTREQEMWFCFKNINLTLLLQIDKNGLKHIHTQTKGEEGGLSGIETYQWGEERGMRVIVGESHPNHT